MTCGYGSLMEPGEQMRRWRDHVRITQQGLANQLQVSVATVSGWERDLFLPRRPMAARIDDALGAGGRLLQAFGYTDDDSVTRHDEVAELRQRVEELAADLERLNAVVAALGGEVVRSSAPARRVAGR